MGAPSLGSNDIPGHRQAINQLWKALRPAPNGPEIWPGRRGPCPLPSPAAHQPRRSGLHGSRFREGETRHLGRELECGSLPGVCCGLEGSKPHVGAQSLPRTQITLTSRGLTQASRDSPQRHGQDGPQEAGKGRLRGGRG